MLRRYFASRRRWTNLLLDSLNGSKWQKNDTRCFRLAAVAMKGGPNKNLKPIRYEVKNKLQKVRVWRGMTVSELAQEMDKDIDDVFELLMRTEYGHTFEEETQTIEYEDLLSHLVKLAGMRPDYISLKVPSKVVKPIEDKDAHRQPPPDPSQCQPRPPVVTIMGHVDHGKTTLLDALRHSQIVEQEFGGITQHIGAFVVTLPHNGRTITFLDTPGHAAFKSMRARGARATDIVVLVVAADDGVMEQTIESIRMAKEAGVSMVVAINKCDKPGIDITRAKGLLMAYDIIVEDYGGDIQAVCISALKGTNLAALQDAIITQADLMSLKADYKGSVEGIVIESKTVHGKGGVCTVLVQRGSLKQGKYLVAGQSWCRVRALNDELGRVMRQALPSIPAEVCGWKEGLPSAGDEVLEVETEKRAKEVIAWRKQQESIRKTENERPLIERKRAEAREKYEAARKKKLERGFMKFDPFAAKEEQPEGSSAGSRPKFYVIIKADVDGSMEALLEVFETYNSTSCEFDVVSFGVGPVSEGDLEMAKTCQATIYCFNIKNSLEIVRLAKEKAVSVKHFNVIYRLVDDWKMELSSRLPLLKKEMVVGEGVVVQDFMIKESGKKGKTPVAGCRCVSGSLTKTSRVRFLRGDEVIYDGVPQSMRIGKDVATSAKVNEEVGIMIDDRTVTFQKNDTVICYDVSYVEQKIDWSPPGF